MRKSVQRLSHPHPALNYYNLSRLCIFIGEIHIHRDLLRDFASHSLSGVTSFFSSVSTTNTASRRAGCVSLALALTT